MIQRSTHRSPRSLLVGAALAAVAASTALPAPVSAQIATTRYSIGYVANTPDLLAGVGASVVFPAFGGLGVFVDAKFDIEPPTGESQFIGTMTAREVQAQIQGVRFLDSDDSWRTYNAGLIRPVTSSLMLYAGAGYAERKRYRFYHDREEEVGEFGFLWVEAPEEEKTTINALFGGYMRVSQTFAFQIGFETAPRGLTVGASLGYPGWY